MRCRIQYLVFVGATGILSLFGAMQYRSLAVAQPSSDSVFSQPAGDDIPKVPLSAPDDLFAAQELPLAPHKALLRDSHAAYEKSVAAFRTGMVADPEVVYRWSMRYMKAERAIGQDPSVGLKGHLRRMEQLVDLVQKQEPTKDTAGAGGGNDLSRRAVVYYRQEAQSLLEAQSAATADPGSVMSRGPLPNPFAPSADALPSKLAGARSRQSTAPKKESAPKQTSVYSLRHAKANDLALTISQLLAIDNPDLRIAVDARTNRVLVNGAADKVAEVEDLIKFLDEPSAESTSERRSDPGPQPAAKIKPGPDE